ncbi:MAG: EscF/YscF/HrpA family type III secretion system needle major subunit [Candidatus Accumulibacter sp.]|jgi:type III secretion protein F|nr:EscF/YscF/HrpA family type III secretion system needle major subunit [Accumulibacter sp.]
MTMSIGSGGGLSQAVFELMGTVQNRSSTLEKEINEKVGNGDQLEQQDLLKMQFEIGQYNALIETASSIGKGVTDMLKTLAQRTS